jgi:hypothetical protein
MGQRLGPVFPAAAVGVPTATAPAAAAFSPCSILDDRWRESCRYDRFSTSRYTSGLAPLAASAALMWWSSFKQIREGLLAQVVSIFLGEPAVRVKPRSVQSVLLCVDDTGMPTRRTLSLTITVIRITLPGLRLLIMLCKSQSLTQVRLILGHIMETAVRRYRSTRCWTLFATTRAVVIDTHPLGRSEVEGGTASDAVLQGMRSTVSNTVEKRQQRSR